MVADIFRRHVITDALESVVVKDVVDAQYPSQIAESTAVTAPAVAETVGHVPLHRMVGIGRRRIVEVARKDHRVGRSIYFDPDFTYLPGTDTTVVFQLAQYSLDGCVAVVIFPEPAPELGDARSLEVDGEETHRIIADEQVGTQVVVVRISKPDVLLNIHIAETKCTLSLDSSGESLHRRGYRQEAVEAPLNEVLAAGMILMTGWHGECDLIDPMCGSGTIPIEAALIARNIAPGVFRKEFAFEKWIDFDQELFDKIYNDDSQEREFDHKIYGYDNNPKANEIATHNIKAAGVSKDVALKLQPFQQFEQPKEKAIIITNPPYGERISTNDLLGLYSMIGERLKHAFIGNTAWILSYREECFDQIGLKATAKIPLFNGALECEFRKYEIFDGKYKEFKKQENEEGDDKEEYRPYVSRERKEFKSGERREFKPRERREFKPDEKREFKPRGYRKPTDGEWKPKREFNKEREFNRDRKPREFRKWDNERTND